MTIFTITTAADKVANDGKLSLREAVAQANATAAADTIVFASGLEDRTLVLTDGELELLRDLTIDGDRNNDGREVTLSGGLVSRILHVTGVNTDAHIRDLTLTHGSATGGGGAIFADDGTALRLNQVAIRDNNAPPDEGGSGYFGGGVWALGSLALSHCTVTGNFASYGGGIAARNLTMNNTTISGNSAHVGGGIHSSGEVKLTDSTIKGRPDYP